MLALLLPFRHRRIRRALAYLAVSVAIVGHSLMASLVPLAVAAYPGLGLGYLLLIVLFVCAAAALAQLLPCLPLRIRSRASPSGSAVPSPTSRSPSSASVFWPAWSSPPTQDSSSS